MLIADAWVEEDKMKHVQFSDLPFKASVDRILLFQPATTVSARIHIHIGRKFLEEAFADAVNLTGLIHIGSVCCTSQNDELGGPFSLGPRCGGRLIIKPFHLVESLRQHEPAVEAALTCSNPACKMEVASFACPTKLALSNLLLHLALKQMIPGLPVGNYLNCALKENNCGLKADEVNAIRALGLIAFASEILWGTVANGFFSNYLVPEHFGFGFMLVPGMQTASGCGGHDEWLKLLVEKKFKSLKEAHRSFAPLLLGIKPSQEK